MQIKPNQTDLGVAGTPKDVVTLLHNIAQRFCDDAGELDSAYQDKHAGDPWRYIARNLAGVATVIEKRIEREGW